MHAGADRRAAVRPHRRRAQAVGFAVALALAAAGCSDTSNGGTSGSSNSPPLVTGEQVVTACFHSYFYNGILPKAAAQTNCKSCVVDRLRNLGIRPASGENVMDMLTGDRLSNTDIQLLQNRCNESDASAQ
ncbi:MAG: hypothetical protein ACRDLT_03175 [Solirubrobacteraceae bacterium]